MTCCRSYIYIYILLIKKMYISVTNKYAFSVSQCHLFDSKSF